MTEKTTIKEPPRDNKQKLSGTDPESQAAAAEIAQVAREIANVGKHEPEPEVDDTDAIPMLTDVLPTGVAARSAAPARPGDAAPPMPEEEWNRVALLVQKKVMKRMLRHTDELVDGQLRDQLDEVLDRGAERLMADLKVTMEQAISAAVSQAIAQELSDVRRRVKAQQKQAKPDE